VIRASQATGWPPLARRAGTLLEPQRLSQASIPQSEPTAQDHPAPPLHRRGV